MTDLILFGPPGSGKSSVAQMLVEHDGYVSLSTGNILREEMALGTPLGLRIDPVAMASGQFSDDTLVNAVVGDRVAATPREQPLIFDGHPRNFFQTAYFFDMMEAYRRYAKIVYLDARPEILLQRVMGRALIEGRADDNAEVFLRRIELFEGKTKQVYAALASHFGTSLMIDTSYVPYEDVYETIRRFL